MDTKTLLDEVKARYTANREWMISQNMIITDLPAEEVSDADWQACCERVTNAMEQHTFTWERTVYEDPESKSFDPTIDVEEGVTIRKPLDEQGVIEVSYSHRKASYEHRPATLAEIIDFIFSGGIENAYERDYEFEQGWNDY